MIKKTPFPSRMAAMLLAFNALLHVLQASDLLFKYFPATPEIVALWAAPTSVKALWVITAVLGIAGVALLYRNALLGLLASIGVTTALYFASTGLWGDLKGTFWIAVIASVLATIGVWRARSNNSFKPNPLRGSA